MTRTSLNTKTTQDGFEYTLDSGVIVAHAYYHGAASLYDVRFSMDVKSSGSHGNGVGIDRMCHGLEATEFYILAIASEYRLWCGV